MHLEIINLERDRPAPPFIRTVAFLFCYVLACVTAQERCVLRKDKNVGKKVYTKFTDFLVICSQKFSFFFFFFLHPSLRCCFAFPPSDRSTLLCEEDAAV